MSSKRQQSRKQARAHGAKGDASPTWASSYTRSFITYVSEPDEAFSCTMPLTQDGNMESIFIVRNRSNPASLLGSSLMIRGSEIDSFINLLSRMLKQVMQKQQAAISKMKEQTDAE